MNFICQHSYHKRVLLAKLSACGESRQRHYPYHRSAISAFCLLESLFCCIDELAMRIPLYSKKACSKIEQAFHYEPNLN